METLAILFSDYTVRVVAFGALILGVTSGCLGTFAVLRRQSLLGDAIAHATLPGVALAFLITGSKSAVVLLAGAAAAGWLGTILVKLVTENTRIKRDAALGIVLSVFFGAGLVLLTIIQRLPSATQAGLDKFLFGNAATLLISDVRTMTGLGLTSLLILLLFWKEFKLLVFDPDFAQSAGLPVHRLDILLTTLIVIAIVIGLQTVGVVLMSAMLVAPAAAARQWTDRLNVMVLLSALIGAAAGVSGSLISALVPRLPTGPAIVIFLSIIVFSSLLFAPNRGLLWDWIRLQRQRRKIHTTTMLKNLLLFSEIKTDPFHPHDVAALDAIGRGTIRRTMQDLQRRGWARQYPDRRWALTPLGLKEARQLADRYEEELNP